MEREGLEDEISYDELNEAVRIMKNNKSPGSEGFPVEFFKFFWKDLGKLILRCINECYRDGEFSFVQRQGVITCIPKPEKDRKYIKDWRPITLLNVVYKMASACIANRVKSVLSELIGEKQRGFIPNRYIGENIRLIYDILEETNKQNISGLLLIVDFEKAFDTVSRNFLIESLRAYGFGPSFTQWIQALNFGSTACVLQNGHMSKAIPVERGCRQGDPLSPYLFVIGVSILSILILSNKDIKGISIHGTGYSIAQHADDTELLLDRSETSRRATLDTLNYFHKFSGLKINVEKTRAI